MNLIERAQTWKVATTTALDTANLLHELAGEVQRLWAFEQEIKTVVAPAWQRDLTELHQRLGKVETESAAEIERLKAATDTAALNHAWNGGFTTAAKAFNTIVSYLLAGGRRHDHTG